MPHHRKACVSCSSSGRRAKLISCLHAVCVPCLEQHVQYDGSIKCPKCCSRTASPLLGWSPLLSLPSAYPSLEVDESSASGPARDAAPVVCDDCADNENAVARCTECGVNLCGDHARTHPRSKASYNHQVTSLADGEQLGAAWQPETVLHCGLHPSQVLTHFCMQCSQLLCQQCRGTGSHQHDRHDILTIDEAAGKSRKAVATCLHGAMSQGDGVISRAMAKVREAIRALHEDTEAASLEIASYGELLRKAVQTRQQDLLAEVDQRRSKHLELLEHQLTRLEEAALHGNTVSDLFESCHDNADFLRMSEWLSAAIDKRTEVMRNDAEPCTASSVGFTSRSETIKQIADGCAVVDLMEDVKVLPASDTTVGNDLVVAVQGSNKDAINYLRRNSRFDVTVSGPDGEALPVCVVPSKQSPLEATCCPPRVGEYCVSFMFGRKHLAGSPVQVSVLPYAPVFDTKRCHSSLVISNKKRTILLDPDEATGGYRAACSVQIPHQHGSSELRVKLDKACDGDLYICACAGPNPRLDDIHEEKAEVFGWCGYGSDGNSNGGYLGQDWKRGDVIRLTLDHDNHTLTGLHESTGTCEVLQNVTGSLCWYISLCEGSDQVTIL